MGQISTHEVVLVGRDGSVHVKDGRRIPKALIHRSSQVSNTTICDVSRCSGVGVKKRSPFCCSSRRQGNAIRAVADQGMQRAKSMIKRVLSRKRCWLTGLIRKKPRDDNPLVPHNGWQTP
ncbi:hypothetical protein CUMW_286660 [Citrus unshiu]|uniref:Uncharacterized protein n=1 Tax=Citrus unshiu TaxID=55188 RepID=A0A2H5MYB2_CITUN|nr:hypothetical protein CUMW_286660 [Citrus unshiu]